MKRNRIQPHQFGEAHRDFGSFLKYLRLRAGLDQRGLGLAVGYGEAQISRLEHNHRLPDLEMLRARFIPALALEDQPELAEHLLKLARQAHEGDEMDEIQSEELGTLEAVPAPVEKIIPRPSVFDSINKAFLAQRAVMLYGFPGVGKSTVCAAVVRQAHESNRPVFWHTVSRADALPLESLIRQLALFLVSTGVEEAALCMQPGALPLEASVMLLATHMRNMRPFVCMDEFHYFQPRLESFSVIENLISMSECKFLFASRERLELAGVAPLSLMGMTEEESRALLKARGLALPAETTKAIHALTQGNPMLLTLAGAGLQRNASQAGAYLEKLAAQREITSYLMERALDGLNAFTLNLLSLIAIFRQPVNLLDVSLAERLRASGLADDLNDAFASLQRRHFLDNPAEARLHPLLQEHLELFLNAKPELHRSLHLLAAHHLRALAPYSVESLYHFVQAGSVTEAIELIQNSTPHWDSAGQGDAVADLIAVLLKRARGLANLTPEDEAQLLSQRGQLLMSGRRAAEAEADFRQALALALESNLSPGERVSVTLRLTRFLLQRGKVPEADQLCDDAENTFVSNPDSGLLAETLSVRGTVRLMQTRLDEASDAAKRALTLAEPFEHREVRWVAGVRAMCHNTLGILSHIRRDIPAALSHWRKAEEAAQLAGNLRTAFRIKGNIGGLHFDQGELDEARQTYEGILDAVQAMGDVFTLGKILNSLGAIYHLQARPAEALELLDRAKQLKQLIGDLQGEATTENQRAQVLLASGRAGDALYIMDRLLKQTEETGEMRWHTAYLDTVGMILLAQGEFSQARERLQEALSLPGAASDPQLNTYLRNHLALAYLGAGEAAEAKKILSREDGMSNSGMVEVETRLVGALVSAAGEGSGESLQTLSRIQEDASQRALYLFANVARRIYEALEEGKPISQCISILLANGALPD